MDSSRKGIGGSSAGGSGSSPSTSGSYRRIIPPLNDTDSDSSLEYWEERPVAGGGGGGGGGGSSGGGGGGGGGLAEPLLKVKKEPETEDDCCQRMVYKVKPTQSPFLRRVPIPEVNLTERVSRPIRNLMAPRLLTPSRSPLREEDVQNEAAVNSQRPTPEGEEPLAKRLRLDDPGQLLNSNILSMIECPVCLEYMGPPIHQCRRGHLVCNSCRAQLVNCPTCRSRFTDLRNLVLERIVEMIKYPCKHDNCKQMHLLKDKSQHELNCEHRRYTCMAQGCDWRGVHSALVTHVKRQHAGLIHDGNHLLVSFPIQMLANSSRNYVLHAFDQMFRVNFQRGPGAALVHGLVIYLGPIDNAKHFTFQFTMQKEKESVERAISFKRTVLSDEHKPSNYYAKSEAFSATVDMLRLIATSKGKVHVDVLIERRAKQEQLTVPPVPGASKDDENEDTNID